MKDLCHRKLRFHAEDCFIEKRYFLGNISVKEGFFPINVAN